MHGCRRDCLAVTAVDGDDDGDSDERSSVAGGVAIKRDIHTINEQRRRDIIKQAYSTLERIVPTCKPNPGSTRLSRATILLKSEGWGHAAREGCAGC